MRYANYTNRNLSNLYLMETTKMFIGRAQELEFLNSAYSSDKAEFIVLYGRRRVGKTELITTFCEDKPNIFYAAKESTDTAQLRSFSQTLIAYDNERFRFLDTFKDWEAAFSALAEIPKEQKLIVAIDEFPYMVKGDKSIPSILQNLWDHKLKNANIMLILSGSSMSFIEDEMLGYKKPLYGRTTGIYKLEPLPYTDTVKFFPDYSDEDKLLSYAVLGGIPHYLLQFDGKKSLKDNILNAILKRGSVLYNEVEFLLHEELREPATYNSIIEAIALGNSEYNDILMKTQIEQRTLSVYLKNLINLGIVKRELPSTSSLKEQTNSSKGIYSLTDNLFRFWYAFCYPNLSLLEKGNSALVWNSQIQNGLHDFASKSFENVCIEYLFRLNADYALPVVFSDFSRWWGKVTHKDAEGKPYTVAEEIDILAECKQKKTYLIGECKFTNEPFDMGQLKKLMGKLSLKGTVYYHLFSLNGFTDGVKDYAANTPNITLVSARDILS